MGQSSFKWIIVYSDGTIGKFTGTWDDFINNYSDAGHGEPLAVIRGEFA